MMGIHFLGTDETFHDSGQLHDSEVEDEFNIDER